MPDFSIISKNIVLFENILQILLSVAPFLLLGLFVSGLLKAFASDALIKKHFSGRGIIPIIKAAIIGMPLPLCSCGVIPVAMSLRKQGASKGATTSFMISTPETGVDSVLVSFVLLGPFMAIARPIAAVTTSIFAGILVDMTAKNREKFEENIKKESTASPCCCKSKSPPPLKIADKSIFRRFFEGQKYSLTTLYDDTFKWLFIGIVAAGAIITYVPPNFFSAYGHSYLSMLLIMLISIPMYTCATASTPIAAGLIAMGISPGTALVFLLAGPATNIATLGVINKELGKKSLVGYLGGIAVCSLAFGILTDTLIAKFNINVATTTQVNEHLIPHYIAWIAIAILIIFQKHIRRMLGSIFTKTNEGSTNSKSCCS